MKKQLLALAIVIAFATSLQGSVRTNEPIFDPSKISDIKSLPVEIKIPINKIVDPNLKNIDTVLLELEKASQNLIDNNIKTIHKEVALLDKNKIEELHAVASKLHQTHQLNTFYFEMALLSLDRTPLSKGSYNNLITRLVDLYNGKPSTKLGESTVNKIYALVAKFADELTKEEDEYNNTISSIAPKLPKVSDKAQHFIAYAIGRITINQQQVMSIDKAKAKTTNTTPYNPGKKMKIYHGPVITPKKPSTSETYPTTIVQ